ncbi:MAG: RNA polymerase-associated protein RapA [Verrucomicrobiales bacterium]|nr:RNA polymerase-associated protein RapA [Verrucomicrobiales bacterium]|tara:strand:- start:19433 stop:22297 length:2865 start_codon:yes stop_codon:yes gene_type:complete
MSQFVAGQRWISESEPELGLGTLVQVGDSRIQILFPASGEMRVYALENAPVKRVRFREGDEIKAHDGETITVVDVREESGLLTYIGDDRELPEAQLSDTISFNRPEDRLLNGQIDDTHDYQLRQRTLQNLHRSRSSDVRGFVGGRIDLIPHQLYIAHEVSSRQAPRVLLSDEVGLGKTIEACLIVHRLLLSGRASRVLVLVPDSLVHQWFVELLRKFNLWFNIFDEDRCASIQAANPDANPFLDDQLILCSINFLTESPDRAAESVAAGWDVLVVDEAHHLEWHPEEPSTGYRLVEQLSAQAEGLLLLTATPEQLGPESHFARLRLLDPNRFSELESFREESRDFKDIATIVEKLDAGKKPTKKDATFLTRHYPTEADSLKVALERIGKGDEEARADLIGDLLDLHGPGRVLFRNTRAAMQDFPRRIVQLSPIKARKDHSDWVDRVSTEFAVDAGDDSLTPELELNQDPRAIWLADLLKQLETEKILLICRTKEKVFALEKAVASHLNVKTAIFHEDLSLVQRDRNAAWFAEQDGAHLLICSEIGSEGRNFQFAHHLVLFDLPLNPELLEQRIGRLDRIGQTQDINIHVPFLTGSPQEVVAHWYHEGLNAFETNLVGGNELQQTFGRQVHDVALEYPAHSADESAAELKQLVDETAKVRKDLVDRMEQGRDRLLEMNSFRPAVAQTLVAAISGEDSDDSLEEFMLDVFEHFGVHAEELGPHTFQLNPQGVITDAFPSLPDEGMIATFERAHALGREDVGFLSWDHPMVTGAMDLLLIGEKGNSSFACHPSPDEKTLLLETTFIFEAIADTRLHVDRFLAPTPIRIVVNNQAADVTGEFPSGAMDNKLEKANPYRLIDSPAVSREVLPKMLEAANRFAETQASGIRSAKLKSMNHLIEHEITRLQTLAKVNDHVRPEEIELATKQKQELCDALENARLRLDSIRMIWKGDPAALQ